MRAELDMLRAEIAKIATAKVAAVEPRPEPYKAVEVPRPVDTVRRKDLPVLLEAPAIAAARQPEPPKQVVAAAALPADAASLGWMERVASLESTQGELTLARALAFLLHPMADHEVAKLLELEARIKQLPLSSAYALGVKDDGGVASWVTTGLVQRAGAERGALENCRLFSSRRCAIIMINGEFQPQGLAEWARAQAPRDVAKLKGEILRLKADRQ
jgi:hypothetical protein